MQMVIQGCYPNKGYVLINGKKAPIVGRVCMDQMMVDITDIPDVKFKSEVVLIGESGDEVITADDLANMIGTIGYEIVCGISKRVDRVYQDMEGTVAEEGVDSNFRTLFDAAQDVMKNVSGC